MAWDHLPDEIKLAVIQKVFHAEQNVLDLRRVNGTFDRGIRQACVRELVRGDTTHDWWSRRIRARILFEAVQGYQGRESQVVLAARDATNLLIRRLGSSFQRQWIRDKYLRIACAVIVDQLEPAVLASYFSGKYGAHGHPRWTAGQAVEGSLAIAAYDNLQQLNTLIMDDTEINALNPFFGNPLHIAASRNSLDAAAALLNNHASVTVANKQGKTALHTAAMKGYTLVLALLLTHSDEADADIKDNQGRTPLSYAAEHGHESTVLFLLDQPRVDISTVDIEGRPPLWWAARTGQNAIIKQLISHGANPNCHATGRSETNFMHKYETPLVAAAYQGHDSTVQCLLDHGAHPGSGRRRGRTALAHAAQHGQERIVRILLGHQLTAPAGVLEIAAKAGRAGVVQLLLLDHRIHADGASPAATNTPLFWACLNGHHEVAKILLRGGADSTRRTHNGRTALSWAAGNGHHLVVRVLLERGVAVDSPDLVGRTPLAHAAWKGHKDVVRVLLEHGADPSVRDRCNQASPINYAVQFGHTAIVELLRKHVALKQPA